MSANAPDPLPDDAAWDDLLRQLRDGEPAPTLRPFFYQRVRQRLEAEKEPFRLLKWLQRPAYAVGFSMFMLLLNIGAALLYVRRTTPAVAAPAAAYAAFVTDYQLDPLDMPHE